MATEGRISSIDHAVDLIEVLSARGEATVTELSTATGLPRATLYRLLRTLAARGIVAAEGKRHRLTLRLHELGVTARSADHLSMRVQPLLDQLVAETGLTAHFAIRDGDAAAFVAKRDAPDAMPMASRIGWRGPLHATAVGKVLLAATGVPDELSLDVHTMATLTDRARLAAHVEAVYRNGYAVDDEELLPGLRCVAVPLTEGGRTLGAVSLSGRVDRIDKPKELAAHLKRALAATSGAPDRSAR